MWTLTSVQVLDPTSSNWISIAISSVTPVARSATRVAEVTAVEVQLRDFKSGSRTSTGVKVHIKLCIWNNQTVNGSDRSPVPPGHTPKVCRWCREEGEGSGGACAVPVAANQFVHVGPTVRKKEERAKLTGMATFFPHKL